MVKAFVEFVKGGAMAAEGLMIRALLAVASGALRERMSAGMAAAGFADLRPAYEAVFALLRPEGDRVVDLARRAHTSKQAMGYLVASLEAAGYLERVPDPTDRRAQLVQRTARGWEVNQTARRLVKELQDELAAQLGPERMQALLELLRDLVEILGADYHVPEPATLDRRIGKS
jgi:DNA-binding MarR family transcriptional regulator